MHFKRERASQLVKKFLQYDVISFDVFDTLILRPFLQPSDLFTTLASKHYLPAFRNIRIQAEKEARDRCFLLNGHREIDIFDIYKVLNETNNIDVDYGVNLELETEIGFCYANPYMQLIFNMLKENGKKIVLASNMYIPANMLEKILRHSGYEGYEKLYVSCDYKKSKTDTTLFSVIQEDFPAGTRFIHIGDNENADFVAPKRVGWESYHYEDNHSLSDHSLETIGISEVYNTYYNAIINNYLNNGILEGAPYNSPYYYYGFVYGGFLVLGYVNYIHRYAKEHNLDKVFFLARDGYILKKVYDQLHSDIPSEYLLWSRHAALVTNVRKNIDGFFQTFFFRRMQTNKRILIKQALEDMGLSVLAMRLKEYGIEDHDQIRNKKAIKHLKKLISENLDLLEAACESKMRGARSYIEPLINNCKRIGLVDIGWRGTGALSLRELIENEWSLNCKVFGLLAGNLSGRHAYDTSILSEGLINSYMFSDSLNRELMVFHEQSMTVKNCIIEILTSAPHPSLLFFDKPGEGNLGLYFAKPESENNKIINIIHKGEEDFVREYIAHSKSFSALLDIPGRDVYLPFVHLSSGIKLSHFRKVFGEFNFPRYVGGIYDSNRTLIETFEDICRYEFNK